MKQALKWIGIGLVGAIVLLSFWGVVVEPRLIDTEEHAARVPGLPAAWEGQRVAVVADYQVGMWWANTSTMRRITERLLEERPAAVLLAGDFVYKPGDDASGEIERIVEILGPVPAAGIPTFAVLGNHDYSLNKRDDPRDERVAMQVADALRRIGVHVLNNEAVALRLVASSSAGAPAALHLVGIGSEWADQAHPEAALQNVPSEEPRIVFMHNPDSFARIPPGEAPFAIAAHTHGGQIRVPGTPSWSWLGLVTRGEGHADGWIEDSYGQPGNQLYINRGVGFSTVPIRINCRPEVSFFRLVAG